MGTVKLNKTNIKTEINKIVEKRRADIKKFLLLNELNKADKESVGSNQATKLDSGLGRVKTVFIFLSLLITSFGLLTFGLIKSRKSSLWTAILNITFLIMYAALTYSVHSKVFGGTVKNVSVLFAIIPLFFAIGLIIFYPTISKPFENTIGYVWLSTFWTKSFEVMENFQSRLFPIEMLNEFENRMPYNWLLTTFDLENLEKSITQLKGEQSTAPGSIITDFYIRQMNDAENIIFKNELKSLVEMKRIIGRCSGIYIASAIGLAFSIAQAVYIMRTAR
jgi:hypothetical protein